MTLIKKKSKMKVLLLTILLSCTQTGNMFLNKVLHNFDRYSYFVAINVKSTSYNGLVIIENDDLFYYFEQTQGTTKDKYKESMATKLLNNEVLDIQDADFERWNFIKVRPIGSVTKNAQKGIDDFTKIYFDGRVLKDGITDDEQTAIINQLFEWEIASHIDDETGYLITSTK